MTVSELTSNLTVLRDWAAREGVAREDIARLEEALSATEVSGAPLQQPAVLVPGLEAAPWHDPARFPWTAVLENAFEEIRAELLAQRSEMGIHGESAALADQGSWNTYYFHDMGERFAENHSACPHTSQALKAVPGIETAGMAYFSMNSPGTHVKPHCGFTNTRIRCHLGLVIPPGCSMRVGNETRTWEEGKCIVFDDSFEHEVWNRAEDHRAVLLLDTWHPDLTAVERKALTFLTGSWKSLLA